MFYRSMLVFILAVVFTVPATVLAAETIRYHGSSTILRAIMYKAAKGYKKTADVNFDLKGKSTGVGIEKLFAGECDIAGGGRPLKEGEKGKGLVETKVFIDAYAVIVNKKCPLDRISTKDFSDILMGNLSSWGETSWALNSKIRIYAPPSKSAHYKNLKKNIGFKELPHGSKHADMTPSVMYDVKSTYTAIGWLSYANVVKNHGVKILEIIDNGQPIAINQANLTSGAYPYSQGMYFYTQGQPEGAIKDFIAFLQSSEGETIIKEAHFFLP